MQPACKLSSFLRIHHKRIRWLTVTALKGQASSSVPPSKSNVLTSHWKPLNVSTNTTLTEFMLDRFKEQPDKAALINGITGEPFTYRQVGQQVRTLAVNLAKQGLMKGDRFVLSAPNSIEAILLLMAVPATGATLTLLNPGLVSDEVEKLLEKNMPQYLATTPDLLHRFSKLSSQMRKVFTTTKADGYMSIQDMIESERGSDMPTPDIDPYTHPGLVHYSSGTTGLPKGVLLSHHNLVSSIAAISSPGVDMFLEHDRSVVIFPLAHIGGSTCIVMGGLYALSTLVIYPQFEFKSYLQACQQYKVTTMILPPPVAVRMISDPLMSTFDLSHVESVVSGAAPISSYVQEELQEKLHLKSFRQVYGMTEMSGLTHMDDKSKTKFGSAGMVLPNVITKIVDPETEVILPPTSTGELWMSGPQVMLGYLKQPEETNTIKTEDGWIKTGDIGYHDEDGNLYIIDRKKDLVKYKGLQVAPAELEGTLLGHPLVADAAVIGVEDAIAGEVPRAYVVLIEGASPGMEIEEDMLQYVADRVAPYKRLRGGISFVSSIPKLPSGKILKRVLRDQYKSSDTSHNMKNK